MIIRTTKADDGQSSQHSNNAVLAAAIPFLVEITACSYSAYWYSRHIGDKMFVVDEDDKRYNVVKLSADAEQCYYYKKGLLIEKADAVVSLTW